METTVVNVFSLQELDALLKAKWEGMKGALANQDIEGAMQNFTAAGKALYKKQFTALLPVLLEIVGELNAAQIVLASVEGNEAVYEILVRRDGTPFSFQLKFIKDSNGLWKIWRF